MRIQKEIDNLERIKEKMATMPLTFEDAIEFHKRVIERVEKERKEINKELGIGDIEKDGFTGRTDNFKTSTPELKKMKLSESLFEEDNSGSIFAQQVDDELEQEERERQEQQKIERMKKAQQERAEKLKDKVWGEKDWVAEREKARKEGKNLDLSNYSEEEKEIINQGLNDFDGDETAKAQYARKKKAEEEKKAKEEKEKAEKEAEKKHQDRLDKAGKIGKTIAELPNSVVKGLNKAGIKPNV